MSKLIMLNNLDDLRALRTLYKKHYTDNLFGYHALNNYIKWFENEPDIKHVTIYTLDDINWRETGLFMIVDRYSLIMNSLKPGDDNLRKAMKLLDWSRGYKVTGLVAVHHDIVSSALKELNIDSYEHKLNVYRLPWQQAINFDIGLPANFKVKPLDIKSAGIVDSFFNYRQSGSQFFFERFIKHNMSIGLYDSNNDDGDDQPIAWCTRCQHEFLSSLCVTPTYRRRGLAELIVKIFARKLSEFETPEDTLVWTFINNEASNALYVKMGFEKINVNYQIFAFCVPKGMEWPLD